VLGDRGLKKEKLGGRGSGFAVELQLVVVLVYPAETEQAFFVLENMEVSKLDAGIFQTVVLFHFVK
jgi:hypothetical protein